MEAERFGCHAAPAQWPIGAGASSSAPQTVCEAQEAVVGQQQQGEQPLQTGIDLLARDE